LALKALETNHGLPKKLTTNDKTVKMEHCDKTPIQRKRALVENHICAGNQEPSAEAIAGCKQQLDEAKAPPNKTSSTRKPEKALILEPRALAFHLKTSKKGLSTYL